ncbi:PLP-dependent aminotransferase family protein [Paludibacterium purpuratum]|uniref:Putative 8-amino-7-oxononanoate synthase n=1 Tax=Paludibacterium purpuratum TaxID=1144873 RepID=A0A4R7AXV5_9NEIS|nr:PLP-dependent aminotransferase family protein [Paludibacterium purpuratum]TDR72509.1 GntR family transcriptional regulator [Paludibacterium purpuratum]
MSFPRYRDIAEQLLAAMARGDYPPGSRLPSVRQLAASCAVNSLTALQAYRWLEQQQRVEARERSGFYAIQPGERQREPVPPSPPAPPGTWVQVDDHVANLLSLSGSSIATQLHMAECDDSLYPSAELSRRLQHKLAHDASLIGAHLPNAVRHALYGGLQHLADEWQMSLPADQLTMTNGCTEAIQLALRSLTRPGDVVAVETPVYFGLLQTIESLGLRVLEIPCTPSEGISLEALAFALRQGPPVRCLVAVANFQNPTGSLMPDDSKRRLVEMMRRHDIPIIEDDVFGDLYFGSDHPKPLKAWDRDGGIIYCSSFTKSFAPTLRLGWFSGGRYHRRMERLKVSNSFATSSLLQATIADCLNSGLYDRQAARLRQHLREQARRMQSAVLEAFPLDTRIVAPQGGMLMWVECPETVDTLALLQRALQASISFAPGMVFSAEPHFRRHLRLSVGYPWTDRQADAIRTLGELAKGAQRASLL